MELLIVLIIGTPLLLAAWLIARALSAGSAIEALTNRLGRLENEVRLLKESRAIRVAPEQAAAKALTAALARESAASPPPAEIHPEPQNIPAAPPVAEVVKPIGLELPKQVYTPPSVPTPPPVRAPQYVKSKAPEPAGAVAGETPPPVPPRIPGVVHEDPVGLAPEPAATIGAGGKGSFEMRLGTYWLVRVGIVMVLTALAFFGNYAYQNFVRELSAGGKVVLLYLGSGLLLGAGAWWQRKAEKPAMRNYAQVLFAGGLAAVYFTTYIAHHIPALCVITSPSLDGLLLLAWAGFMAWIADRHKSEVLALFAVGLAYYTSIITRVGEFTLYSNLVLTVAAIVFLVRNRWAGLSLASLIATYVSYAYWRFFNGSEWHWATPEEGLWFGSIFLMAYWALFTAAAMLSKHEKLMGTNRAGFVTLNNGAFFGLFLLTMLQVHTGGFWKFALMYGTLLVALAMIWRGLFPEEPVTKNAYLTQGLLLVTVGFVAKYAGLQLALVLGMETVLLYVLGTMLRNRILQVGSYLAGAAAVGWAFDSIGRDDAHGLWLGSALGVFMLFNSFWAHRQKPVSETGLRPLPSYFAGLAIAVWAYTTWQNVSEANVGPVLALESVLFALSIYVLGVPEIALLGQTLLIAGHCLWQYNLFDKGLPPWWNPVLMIAMTLALGHWWQRQQKLAMGRDARMFTQVLLSVLFVFLTWMWLDRALIDPAWMMVSCLLAVGVTIYAVVTRAWLLAACAQFFLLPGAWLFVQQVGKGAEPHLASLVPVSALLALSLGAVQWFRQKPDAAMRWRDPLLALARGYRWLSLAMSLWWVLEYIDHREQIWTLMLIGLVLFLLAGRLKNIEAVLFGGAFSATAILLIWVRCLDADLIYWPNLLAILVLLGQQRIAHHLRERYAIPQNAHDAIVVAGGLTLWLFVSRWVLRDESGFYLTIWWSALALVLFGCGMVLRERMYRWLGLLVLAGALGRVVMFDVWKLETIYRILSFLALGIVLLILGFIYNKYQEKIRLWL